MFHGRSKHIEVQYHRIRDWVNNEVIAIEKVHIDVNACNYLTKSVIAEKFKHCSRLLNLVAC